MAPEVISNAAQPARAYGVLVWLSLLCLDAPLVAVSWTWFFARTFGIALGGKVVAALFLTAWLIYLADRFVDNLSLGKTTSASLRQRFCREHRRAWLVGLLVVGLADLVLISCFLETDTLFLGGMLGVGALIYLSLNQLTPFIWSRLPLKEVCVGVLFAAGVFVPLWHGVTSASALSFFLFAALCSLNCISIAVWERHLDLAQKRISISTAFPIVNALLLPGASVLCLTSAFLGKAEIALSAAMLALLQIFRERVPPDARTALADLVLLTPLVEFALRR